MTHLNVELREQELNGRDRVVTVFYAPGSNAQLPMYIVYEPDEANLFGGRAWQLLIPATTEYLKKRGVYTAASTHKSHKAALFSAFSYYLDYLSYPS